jgi:hypothetical protein
VSSVKTIGATVTPARSRLPSLISEVFAGRSVVGVAARPEPHFPGDTVSDAVTAGRARLERARR